MKISDAYLNFICKTIRKAKSLYSYRNVLFIFESLIQQPSTVNNTNISKYQGFGAKNDPIQSDD